MAKNIAKEGERGKEEHERLHKRGRKKIRYNAVDSATSIDATYYSCFEQRDLEFVSKIASSGPERFDIVDYSD